MIIIIMIMKVYFQDPPSAFLAPLKRSIRISQVKRGGFYHVVDNS